MKQGEWNIPKHEIEILARHFLPYIQAFFESEEGKKEYEEWLVEQAKKKHSPTTKWLNTYERAESENSLPLVFYYCYIKI